jgi:ATP-dependent Clp protease ATP-binding subunit ClpX
MSDMGKDNKISCSFCSRRASEVKKIIAKLDPKSNNDNEKVAISICDLCIEKCNNLIKKEQVHKMEEYSHWTPESIRKYLDDYVEGQDDAKIAFAVAIYNHYHRISSRNQSDTVVEKSNVILVGPSGCGKTLMIKIIAKLLDLPLVIIDSSVITAAGYVGNDVESILLKLLQAADYNVEKAEKGIIYLDEIDKIAKKDITGNSKDISGECVQQELLTLLEGSSVNVAVNTKRSIQQESVTVDTTNILFIGGGAFPDLMNIIKKRIKSKAYSLETSNVIDINTPEEKAVGEYLKYVSNEDFENFGFIREFINRFPVVITMKELTPDQMFDLMKNKKNSFIKQYQKLFSDSNVTLEFTDEAIRFIVDFAMKQKGGVRSVKRILETILKEDMYIYFSQKEPSMVVIDTPIVEIRLADQLAVLQKKTNSESKMIL